LQFCRDRVDLIRRQELRERVIEIRNRFRNLSDRVLADIRRVRDYEPA
jgi:hypothetical protein